MKPRTLRTTKLLAVALVAPMSATLSFACAPQRDATPERASADLAARQAPSSPGAAPTEATATLSPSPSPAPCAQPAANAAAPSGAHPVPEPPNPALYPLAAELDSGDQAAAFARLSHFRPLCDKDGFPLVGNVIRKGPAPGANGGYPPSQFCADVRKKGTR